MAYSIKIYLILLFLLGSCAHYSEYFQKEGNYLISNGRLGNVSWNDDLEFKRYSWYKELNMYFDLMIVEFPKKSPYKNWLSISEKNSLKKCAYPGVVIYFSSDNPLISIAEFKYQLRSQGIELIDTNSFKKHIIVHPDTIGLGLVDYNLKLICNLSASKEYIINFPSFQQQTIKF